MRLNTMALGFLLPAAAVLSGCGMGNLSSSPVASVSTQAIKGKAFGGQQPVVNSQIALYAFGSSGYGSAGQLLATTRTDSGGFFNIDPAAINCPTPNTPVYLLSLGGDPGFGNNSAVALGAPLGRCADAAVSFVTINEINTAMLAYSFSHFFATGSASDGVTTDHFGAPASENYVLSAAYPGIFTLVDVENGYPRKNTGTTSFEGPKLITLGNILGACVNSVGPTSPSCNALFNRALSSTGVRPTNTLQAAVNIALSPKQNVATIFTLQPPSGAAAFTGGLTTSPSDWTLSASFTSSAFGLGLNARTASTIDIDTAGRVWFPSNGPGRVGVGFFDQSAGGFSTLYAAGLSHPQQVAIDVDNVVWANDTASPNIAGFPAASPGAPTVLRLPGTTSTSVTTAFDNSMRFGIVAPDGLPALAKVTAKTSYSEVGGSEVPGGNGFIPASLAGDVVGGFGIGGQQLNTPTTYDLYFSPNGGLSEVTYQSFQDAGQVVFTGHDFIGTRGGYDPQSDGICIFSSRGCFAMTNPGTRHPSGLSLDGVGALWLADNNGPFIEQVPLTNGSYLTANNTANNLVYTHDANNGGTLVHPAGIAVDRAGNVWVSNYGCYGNGCTPGSFVLSELIGAGAPTITPVSRQVVIDNLAGTEPQAKPSSPAR